VVADDGVGMTPEQLARAFDDFYTTKPDGTGLGLSIVRRLAMDLGASVALESARGQGTRATVTFHRSA
jgi:signal transduction histidine kinase